MSKIGKQEFIIPAGVSITVSGNTLTVKGKEGTITKNFDASKIAFNVDGDKATVSKLGNGKQANQLWGTWGSHLKSMLKGVETPFTKKLIIEGVGFKWEVKGNTVHMSLGFSHPTTMKIPGNLTVKADKTTMDITGISKEEVATFAKDIRKLKEPEPYKGKGIRYSDEVIRRKQGKRSA